MTRAIDTARAAWGAETPDWVETLARACDATSQNRVANQLDRSASLVSQVLRGKYPGDLVALEERVRAIFEASEVSCPTLGQLPTAVCLGWREAAREFVNTNPVRVRMYRACHRCPRHVGTREGGRS